MKMKLFGTYVYTPGDPRVRAERAQQQQEQANAGVGAGPTGGAPANPGATAQRPRASFLGFVIGGPSLPRPGTLPAPDPTPPALPPRPPRTTMATTGVNTETHTVSTQAPMLNPNDSGVQRTGTPASAAGPSSTPVALQYVRRNPVPAATSEIGVQTTAVSTADAQTQTTAEAQTQTDRVQRMTTTATGTEASHSVFTQAPPLPSNPTGVERIVNASGGPSSAATTSYVSHTSGDPAISSVHTQTPTRTTTTQDAQVQTDPPRIPELPRETLHNIAGHLADDVHGEYQGEAFTETDRLTHETVDQGARTALHSLALSNRVTNNLIHRQAEAARLDVMTRPGSVTTAEQMLALLGTGEPGARQGVLTLSAEMQEPLLARLLQTMDRQMPLTESFRASQPVLNAIAAHPPEAQARILEEGVRGNPTQMTLRLILGDAENPRPGTISSLPPNLRLGPLGTLLRNADPNEGQYLMVAAAIRALDGVGDELKAQVGPE